MNKPYILYWVCTQCAGIEGTSMYVRGITHWHGDLIIVLRSSRNLAAAKSTSKKIKKQKGE